MPIKSTPSLFISFSEIECKIIDNAGCFENTPEKRGLSPFYYPFSECPLFHE